MHSQRYFAIVVNGVERFWRSSRKDATRHANNLRTTHGTYNVWIRQHHRLLTADGSPVNL